MKLYKLLNSPFTGKPNVISTNDGLTSIPFAIGNMDYQNFKSQINADEAQLEDADGNLMTPEEANTFVAQLP